MFRTIIFSILILVAFYSCSYNSLDKGNDSKSIDLLNAKWIGDSIQLPAADSLFYLDDPAPIFRKEFEIKEELKSARLFITSAGYYNATLNGEKIGKNFLEPAWTNFEKRVYYTEYDLLEDLIPGRNCIGISLGNGFYNPLPLKMWGHLNLREHLPVGKPQFIASLKIEYADGRRETIETDKTWKYSYGPIQRNNVYLGEVYDARKELSGWNKIGYNDKQWGHSSELPGPGGELQKAFFPAIQVTDIKKPVKISSLSNSTFLVDMGVNFTGLYRVKLSGNPGDIVTFRFGERIYDNGQLNPMTTVAGQIKRADKGGPGAPEIAWQTDTYIFGNEKEVWYSPVFTFHTWRYMEISGISKKPQVSDIEGLALNTNVESKSSFSCSSELLNSIQEATVRTFLANLQSVQSDCPAREKFGYGGDLNATAESFIYNFDMQSFYRKTIYDWLDAMNDSIFIDTAPFVGINYCGISWESAFLTTQYNLYLYYNDNEIVKELYEADLKWMEKVANLHPDGIVKKGLSDHESMEPVPVELTGTSHYLQCALIMIEFASLMGDEESEEQFEKLALKLTRQLSEMYWSKSIPDPINRQTLFSTLLYNDIIPQNDILAAIDSLSVALENGPTGHLNTGIFGTKYMLETLSRARKTNEVFNVVNSTEYPGWGFMIDKGATTLWETWKESDNTYSNNHPMFGSVSEWFFKWLGGIKPDPENPGFEKFYIEPLLPDGLEYVKCSYQSPFGKIVSNWEVEEAGHIVFEILVPEGSIAIVNLHAGMDQNIEISDKIRGMEYSPEKDLEADGCFELRAGEYTIVLSKIVTNEERPVALSK